MQQLLKQQYRKMRGEETDGGFTLIELLVVIVILAILAAVVVFAVGGISDKGQTSSCQADRRTLETAEEAKFAQDSTYVAQTAADVAGDLVPQYLAAAPTLHTAALAGSSYTITGTGKCVNQ